MGRGRGHSGRSSPSVSGATPPASPNPDSVPPARLRLVGLFGPGSAAEGTETLEARGILPDPADLLEELVGLGKVGGRLGLLSLREKALADLFVDESVLGRSLRGHLLLERALHGERFIDPAELSGRESDRPLRDADGLLVALGLAEDEPLAEALERLLVGALVEVGHPDVVVERAEPAACPIVGRRLGE